MTFFFFNDRLTQSSFLRLRSMKEQRLGASDRLFDIFSTRWKNKRGFNQTITLMLLFDSSLSLFVPLDNTWDDANSYASGNNEWPHYNSHLVFLREDLRIRTGHGPMGKLMRFSQDGDAKHFLLHRSVASDKFMVYFGRLLECITLASKASC